MTRYFGKVCEKHPELKGERMVSTRGCVGCKRERWIELDRKRRNTQTGKEYTKRKKVSQQRKRQLNKSIVFKHYGGVCSRCGFDDTRALTIDHADQRGSTHKMANGKRYTGPWLYKWLIDNGMPDGFRTLCANCQMIVYHESKER